MGHLESPEDWNQRKRQLEWNFEWQTEQVMRGKDLSPRLMTL